MVPTLNRTAVILLAAASLGACATVEPPKPNFPIVQDAPPPPDSAADPAAPATPDDPEPAPQAAPTSPVESRPIEPPRSQPLSAAPARLLRVRNQVVQGETETRVIAGGRVVDTGSPGRTHTVKSGETVYRIALGFKVSPEELARINNLGKPPWIIRPGQVLRGPGSGGGKAYVVADGDTLGAVAQRFGVTQRALASANSLGPDATLRAGQRLKLPAGFKDAGPQRIQVVRTPSAPPTPPARAPAAAPTSPAPGASTARAAPAVAPNTPAPVAATPQPAAPPRQAAAPPAQTPATLAPSPPPTQAALPPPTARPAPAPARPGPAPGPLASVQPTRPQPALPTRPAAPPAPPAIAPTAPSSGELEVASLGRGRFLWPVRGEIISRYGPQGGAGQRNDGINIRAAAGETVRAVAAGDVVYAGDQVPGFGNLVLIKHPGGWVSAYGHLSRVDVRIQEQVGQGQQIGLIGASGGVPEPQLHFEIRYAATPQDRARPIDPTLVLPR